MTRAHSRVPRAGLIAVVLFGLLGALARGALAQGAQVVPVVTSATPLPLASTYGVPQVAAVNANGDLVFIGRGNSAIFSKPAGQPVARILQIGDALPSLPGSSAANISQSTYINASGRSAFAVVYDSVAAQTVTGLFTYDGTIHQVAADFDPAPGGGGQTLNTLFLIGINDVGDVAFRANVVSADGSQETPALFVAPAGGGPLRQVLTSGDPLPGAGGAVADLSLTWQLSTAHTQFLFGNVLDSPAVFFAFNNRAEILFRTTVGAGFGVFVVDGSGNVRRVAATGDARPVVGGTFTIGSSSSGRSNAFLNNNGDVAFTTNNGAEVWIGTAAGGLSRVIANAAAAPGFPGATLASYGIQVFNDAGTVALTAVISGGVGTGLFRYTPTGLELAAYGGQAPTGTPGLAFCTASTACTSAPDSFIGLSMNAAGDIGFLAELASGGALSSLGLFKQTAGIRTPALAASLPSPALVALHGAATPVAGGGTYALSRSGASAVLGDGSVFFPSDIAGGSAYFGLFLANGGVSALLSTTDPLPAGAKTQLLTPVAVASGDFVSFTAQQNGGPLGLLSYNVAQQNVAVVAVDGDVSPQTGNRRLRIGVTARQLIAGGGRAFSAQLVGPDLDARAGIFVGSLLGGVQKVVADGDAGVAGAVSSTNTVSSNAAGLVAFVTTGTCGGIHTGSPGNVPQAIALFNRDLAACGAHSDPLNFNAVVGGAGRLHVNSSGHVAFVARNKATSAYGVFVGQAGTVPTKVVGTGDPGPGGSTFDDQNLTQFTFNDAGEVAWFSELAGGPGSGVFVGSVAGPPVAVALAGEPVPALGGTYVFTGTTRTQWVQIANGGTVAFRAGIAGGSATAAYFVRRGGQTAIAPVLWQGQSAPGTSSVFANVASGRFNAVVIGPDEDVAIQTGYVGPGNLVVPGSWHVRPDNSLEEMLARGAVAPAFGGGTVIGSQNGAGFAFGGRFPLWLHVSGGTFTTGMFLWVPPTAVVNTPPGSSIAVQPTDATTSTAPVSVTFGTISQAGATALTTAAGGPTLPTAFALGNPPVFYNLETTAVFQGTVTVCIDTTGITFPNPASLRLLHYEGAQWVDITTSVTGPVACGVTTTLSPFAVGSFNNRPPTANAGTDQTLEATSPAGASVSLSGAGSDADGDALSFAWREGVTPLGTGASLTLGLPLGVHDITLTVADGRGGTGTDTTRVTVRDTIAPVVTPPPNQSTQTTGANAVVTYPQPVIVETGSGIAASSCTPASGATFPLGVTTVSCTATDLVGLTGSAAFTVTVTSRAQGATIRLFTPRGAPGTIVSIWGTSLGGTTAVRFNGLAAVFSVVNPLRIVATVPVGATTGPIVLTTASGDVTTTTPFVVAPRISGVAPLGGVPGASVVIAGANFSGATAVRFNGTAAVFVVNSATQITATVPATASTGVISVTTSAGTATSPGPFVVTPQTASLASMPTGTNVAMTGPTAIDAGAFRSAVRFEGRRANGGSHAAYAPAGPLDRSRSVTSVSARWIFGRTAGSAVRSTA